VTVCFESEDDLEESSRALADAVSAVAIPLGSRISAPSIVRLDTQVGAPLSASVRELAPRALAAAILTLAIILTMLRSASAAVIVVSAVALASAGSLGVLHPAKLGLDASTVVGLLLASILIVDSTLRANDAFGRQIAVGLQRRAAAQAAGIELARSAATVLASTVALLAAFVVATRDAIPFVKSIATITIAGAVLAFVVAVPVVLAMSSVWAETARGTRKRTFLTRVLYVFDGCVDRIADRYHDTLAWTLDRRRLTPVFVLSAAALGVAALHGRRAIAPRIDPRHASTLASTDRAPVSLAVRGPDWQTLSGVAQRVAEELRATSGIANVRVSAKPQGDGGVITDFTVLSSDVSLAKNRLAPEEDPGIVEVSSPLQIDHLDGDRVIRVDADVTGAAGNVLSNMNARLAFIPLPPQYRVSIEGLLPETRRATITALRLFAFAIAILALVLWWHFRSTASVLTTLVTLGVTSLGTTLAISIARLPFDLFALLGGAVALALIAAHAITAVDYASAHRTAALGARVAVIEAARSQFRPLLTTTLAAVGTVLPLVAARAPAMEPFASLGVAALGGIVIGSLAVLFALPTLSLAIAEQIRRLRGEPLL
jgi:multidrug efflux pump subunit AcrB